MGMQDPVFAPEPETQTIKRLEAMLDVEIGVILDLDLCQTLSLTSLVISRLKLL